MVLADQFLKPSVLAGLGTALFVLYSIGWASYQLYFSPLAKFPGPKLAAVTLWYSFYYDVICGGQYVFKIRELHKQYGPIIRISPYEVHLSDPDFYEEIFSGPTQKRNKYEWFTRLFASPLSSFATPDHNLHRLRRGAINRYFSKGTIRSLQPIIQGCANNLLKRIGGFQESGNPLTISLAYTAYSSDVIMEYTFGRSYHRLDQEDFDPDYAQSIHEGAAAANFNKYFILPFHLLLASPPWLGNLIAPGISMFIAFVDDCRQQVRAIMDGSNTDNEKATNPTIFHDILAADNLPPAEKRLERLVQEAQVIVSAGTETTSWAMSVITFNLLSNPKILQKLQAELEAAIPDPSNPLPLATLEQLPYLTACIQEGLRLSYGVSTRSSRISPEKPIIFNDGKKEWSIPPGTPANMTTYLIHHDEKIFPSSYEYIPERWIDNPRLQRYLVSFSKGTRQCVGINLAYAEMYVGLSSVFRHYGGPGSAGSNGRLELFETTEDDVIMVADRFVPFVKEGSKGIRVLVTK